MMFAVRSILSSLLSSVLTLTTGNYPHNLSVKSCRMVNVLTR